MDEYFYITANFYTVMKSILLKTGAVILLFALTQFLLWLFGVVNIDMPAVSILFKVILVLMAFLAGALSGLSLMSKVPYVWRVNSFNIAVIVLIVVFVLNFAIEIPHELFVSVIYVAIPLIYGQRYVLKRPTGHSYVDNRTDEEMFEELLDGTREITDEQIYSCKTHIVALFLNCAMDIEQIRATVGSTIIEFHIYLTSRPSKWQVQKLRKMVNIYYRVVEVKSKCISVEMPYRARRPFSLESALRSESFYGSTAKIPLIIGSSSENSVVISDLSTLPHLMIAGGSNHSRLRILSLFSATLLNLKSKDRLKLFFDGAESNFSELHPDILFAGNSLKSVANEMYRRYEVLRSVDCKHIKEYNALSNTPALPYIIIITSCDVDCNSLHTRLEVISSEGPNVGMHIIVAIDEFESLSEKILNNFPARLVLKVESELESKLILGEAGAEKLLDSEDALFRTKNGIERVQCTSSKSNNSLDSQ